MTDVNALNLSDLIKMLEALDEVEQLVINETLSHPPGATQTLRLNQRAMMREGLLILLRYMGLHYTNVNDAAQALERLDSQSEVLADAVHRATQQDVLDQVIHSRLKVVRDLIDIEIVDLMRGRSYDSRSTDEVVDKIHREVLKVVQDPKSLQGVLAIVHANERVTGAAIRHIRGAYVNEIRSAKLLAMLGLQLLNDYRARNPNWQYGWRLFMQTQHKPVPATIED